jgi:uncharacterized protein YdaU (DUF1376 family)
MPAPPYMKLYWGDYHRGTRHLRTAAEHGAYLLLIGALWDGGGRIAADDETLARHAQMTEREWAKARVTILPFFKVARGWLTHKRVSEELAKFDDISRKRRGAGKTGGEVRAGKTTRIRQANASRLPTYTESESLNPLTPLQGGERSKSFNEAWDTYPIAGRANEGPDRAASAWVAAAKRAGGEAALLAAVRLRAAHVARDPTERVKVFHRWLAADGFAAYLSAPQPADTRQWPGPADVWAALVVAKGEPWVRSWVMACEWQDVPRRALLTSSPTVLARLRTELGSWLDAAGIGLEARAA